MKKADESMIKRKGTSSLLLEGMTQGMGRHLDRSYLIPRFNLQHWLLWELSRSVSVSYTHLDVYKRQVFILIDYYFIFIVNIR